MLNTDLVAVFLLGQKRPAMLGAWAKVFIANGNTRNAARQRKHGEQTLSNATVKVVGIARGNMVNVTMNREVQGTGKKNANS